MIKRHKFDVIAIFGIVGFAVSLFLAITHYMGFTVPCDITHGCEVVLNSKYSAIAGIPLSVVGVVYFSGVIVSALLANHYNAMRKILTFILGVGALSSLVFLSLQFFVIKSVCQYCLVTDVLSIALFIWDINIERKGDSPSL